MTSFKKMQTARRAAASVSQQHATRYPAAARLKSAMETSAGKAQSKLRFPSTRGEGSHDVTGQASSVLKVSKNKPSASTLKKESRERPAWFKRTGINLRRGLVKP